VVIGDYLSRTTPE